MDLPAECLIGNVVIEEGKIYRFLESLSSEPNIIVNHMHICFVIHGSVVCLVCASRNKSGAMTRWVESRGIAPETIVKIIGIIPFYVV